MASPSRAWVAPLCAVRWWATPAITCQCLPRGAHLPPLAEDAARKLQILDHHLHTLSVRSAWHSVLEKLEEVRLSRLLHIAHCLGWQAQPRSAVDDRLR